MSITLSQILENVQCRADEQDEEVLFLLYKRMINRPPLSGCYRHDKYHKEYVNAQLKVHYIKKYLSEGLWMKDSPPALDNAILQRDKIRAIYRSTRCTWIIKR